MEAPLWFRKELAVFDPDLRIRWSRRLELWQLERRVRRSLHPGTINNDHWHDDYIRAQDGFLLVASIPPRGLTRELFRILRANDLWSNGGWNRIADALDEDDRFADEQREFRFGQKIREYSREVYNLMKIRDGRTVFNVLGATSQ